MTLSTEALIGLGLIVVFLVGSYLWYLWGLARLFPLLGLPETQGWIPVRNEMALLDRGRVPGWIAILFLLPGIFVVPLVARGIAVHRIHREHRRGGGWTALAVAYPALWATIFWLELSDHPDLARMPAGTGRVGGLAQPTQSRETAPAEPARPGVFPDGFDEWGFTPVAGAAGEPVPGPVPAPASVPAPAVSVAGVGAGPGPGPGPVPQPVALPSAAELPVAAAAPAPADAPAAAPGSRFAPALPDAGHPRAAADAREERDARDLPEARSVSEVPDARDDLGDAASAVDVDDDDDLDETVIVRRAPVIRWVLALPDGSELALPADAATLGRRPGDAPGAVTVPDPSRTLSKVHARIRWDGDRWFITDLGSTNGVFLGEPDGSERELAAHVEAPLSERFRLGTLPMRLLRSGS